MASGLESNLSRLECSVLYLGFYFNFLVVSVSKTRDHSGIHQWISNFCGNWVSKGIRLQKALNQPCLTDKQSLHNYLILPQRRHEDILNNRTGAMLIQSHFSSMINFSFCGFSLWKNVRTSSVNQTDLSTMNPAKIVVFCTNSVTFCNVNYFLSFSFL